MRSLVDQRGASSVERLAALLLLDIIIVAAASYYFASGAESAAKSRVDQANVSAINSALALYKLKHDGSCPAAALAFDAFLADSSYFPDGTPTDPYRNPPDAVPYNHTYSATLCRVLKIYGGIDHTSGAGH